MSVTRGRQPTTQTANLHPEKNVQITGNVHADNVIVTQDHPNLLENVVKPDNPM